MTFLCSAFILVAIVAVALAANSFGGTNNMLAHALSSSEQDQYIAQLYADNVKVIRLWVDGVGPGLYSPSNCEKGSTITPLAPLEVTPGSINSNATLAAIDTFLGKLYNAQPAGKPRIKAIISPHNSGALNSGNSYVDGYGQWYGTGDFYTDSNAISYYKNRLSYIINFQSPWFGVPWKNLDYMILGFDVQNEPLNAVSDPTSFSGNTWLCNIASFMRSQLGASNTIKVVSGGVGGGYTNYNTASFVTGCGQIDIVALHGYQPTSTWQQFIPSDVNNVNGKLLLVEEWGVGAGYTNVATSEFSPTVSLFNSHGIPFLYWEVISGADNTQGCSGGCCQQYLDGYEIGPGSSKVSPSIGSAITSANSATAAQGGWSSIIQ